MDFSLRKAFRLCKYMFTRLTWICVKEFNWRAYIVRCIRVSCDWWHIVEKQSKPGGLTDLRASKVQLLWEGSTCGAAQVNPLHRGLLLVSWQTCAVFWLVDIGAALLRRRYRLYEHSAYLGGRYDAKWAAFIYPRHSFPGPTHGKLELANIRGHKLWCWFISKRAI